MTVSISTVHACPMSAPYAQVKGNTTATKDYMVYLSERCTDTATIKALLDASALLPHFGGVVDGMTVCSASFAQKTQAVVVYQVSLASNPSQNDPPTRYASRPWQRAPIVNRPSSTIMVPVTGIVNSAGEEFTNLTRTKVLRGYSISFAVRTSASNETLINAAYSYQGKYLKASLTISRGVVNTTIEANVYYLQSVMTNVELDTDPETGEDVEYTRLTIVFAEMPEGPTRSIPDFGYNRLVNGVLEPIMVGTSDIPTSVPVKLSNTPIDYDEYTGDSMSAIRTLVNLWASA